MNDIEKKKHLGIFSGSEAHRLMAGTQGDDLMDTPHLMAGRAIINSLPRLAFNSVGIPSLEILNSKIRDDQNKLYSHNDIKLIMKKKSNLKGLKTYAIEKALEIIQGYSAHEINNGFESQAMKNGIELEGRNIELLSTAVGLTPSAANENQQFLMHPDANIDLGATPDAVFFNDNFASECIAEAKCRILKNHLQHIAVTDNKSLLKIEKKAYIQMQVEMACAEVGYGYYSIYCPVKNKDYKHLEFHYTRIERDDKMIEKIIDRTKLAMIYRDEYLAKYNKGN